MTNPTRPKLSDICFEVAKQFEDRTAWTSYSCCALESAMKDGFTERERRMARQAYSLLFMPQNPKLLHVGPDGLPYGLCDAWLASWHSDMEDYQERQEWRATALCFLGVMLRDARENLSLVHQRALEVLK